MIEGSQNAATESVGPSKTQHFPEHTPDPVTSSALPADELAREQALAQALVEGRRLHISGGDYVLCPRGEECPGRDCARRDCGMGRCGCGACLRSKEN